MANLHIDGDTEIESSTYTLNDLLEISKKLKATGFETLWTNSNPESSYSGGSITVKNDNEYDFLMLVYDAFVPYHNYCTYMFKKPAKTYNLPYGQTLYSGGVQFRERYITRNNNTTYTFTNGGINGSANPSISVPLILFGFKLENITQTIPKLKLDEDTEAFIGSIIENKINSTNLVQRVINLENRLNSQRILRGIYDVITVPRSMGSGTGVRLEERYNFKERLLEAYPIKEGFDRKYILMIDINTGTSGFNLYIGGYLLFTTSVWGENSNIANRSYGKEDVTEVINKLGLTHTTITGTTSDFAYINKCYLLVYDEYIN